MALQSSPTDEAMSKIRMPFLPFDIESQILDFSAYVGNDPQKRKQLDDWRRAIRGQLNLSDYEGPGRQWYREAWQEVLVFKCDKSFYDVREKRYRIDEYLDEGEREFGGYDALMLWQGYPRLGIDRRNQKETR
jgi:hypothetical protein